MKDPFCSPPPPLPLPALLLQIPHPPKGRSHEVVTLTFRRRNIFLQPRRKRDLDVGSLSTARVAVLVHFYNRLHKVLPLSSPRTSSFCLQIPALSIGKAVYHSRRDLCFGHLHRGGGSELTVFCCSTTKIARVCISAT